jgi:hypothetical protein
VRGSGFPGPGRSAVLLDVCAWCTHDVYSAIAEPVFQVHLFVLAEDRKKKASQKEQEHDPAWATPTCRNFVIYIVALEQIRLAPNPRT